MKPQRLLIILDASALMDNKWENGENRYDAASRIILGLVDSVYHINNNVEFSLRVYGHQYALLSHNCFDTHNEIQFSRDNYTQMSLRLADIKPLGQAPIAYTIQEAAETDMADQQVYAYSVVLVKGANETCSGDLCSTLTALHQKNIDFAFYVVDVSGNTAQPGCLKNRWQVNSGTDIPVAINAIAENFRRLPGAKRPSSVPFTAATDQQPLDYTEQMPVPTFDISRYLDESLTYPKEALMANIEGKVIVKFIVTSKGGIDSVHIVRSVSHSLDSAAVKVVTEMPPWLPGMVNGTPVPVYYTIPVVFKLETKKQK